MDTSDFWYNEDRRNVNETLLLAAEEYKNFLDSKDIPVKVDEIEITLSTFLDAVLYPEHTRNRAKMTIFGPGNGHFPGGAVGCALAISAGPMRGRCQNRLRRGDRLYCNKEIHKKGRCRYHWRRFRIKHHL